MEDKFARLPDDILCHILSFLHTKDAIRNSLLSKRWRHLWTFVPCIEVVDTDIKMTPRWNFDYFKHGFENFVFMALRLKAVYPLRRFCLRCFYKYDGLLIDQWIKEALSKRDLEELDLDFTGKIELPPSVFTCKRLVILKLQGIFFDALRTTVYLPSLKILCLHLICCSSGDNDLKNFIDGCPVLEELDILTATYDNNVKTLFIRSSSLKRLTLYTQCENVLRIVIDAPNLERLHITDHRSIKQYDITSLSSLVKVNLHVCKSCPCNRLLELLRKLTHVKYMFLSCSNTQSVKCTRRDQMPMFRNLTHLVVKFYENPWPLPIESNCGPVLPYLLECSPNLVKFIFRKAIFSQPYLPFKAPKCLMLYLEEVELIGFKTEINEIEMVKYFLNNATILKKLSILCQRWGSNLQSKVYKELLKYPRRSLECQLFLD